MNTIFIAGNTQPCNICGTEARARTPNPEISVHIFLSNEQGANSIKVPVKLRSLILILPRLLQTSELNSLIASQYGQID